MPSRSPTWWSTRQPCLRDGLPAVTILIGLAPGQRDDGAVHLGGMLARSSGEDIVVVSVVPSPWPPNPYRGDKEYLAYQEKLAEAALGRARDHLGDSPLGADYVMCRAESAHAGLLQLVAERRCGSVVVGSSTMGLLGHVMLGGVAERILHSAELPILVAPRGFHAHRATSVSRVSVAFGRADHDSELVLRAASVARSSTAALRVVCFAVRPMAAVVGAVEEGTEQLVVAEWMERLEDEIAATLASIWSSTSGGRDGPLATQVDTDLGQGTSWSAALHDVAWTDGDLLAVGISSGPLGRVFLGSHAAKIVRASPVPVMLLSRG
jgi:nucleotide-binding universal stress UspA family protein